MRYFLHKLKERTKKLWLLLFNQFVKTEL